MRIITKKNNKEGVRGYKVFNPDWTCKEKQYTCPGTFKEKGLLEIRGHGMHFCQNITKCFDYYDFDPSNHVAEVIAWGTVVTEDNKSCTNELEIIRELTWQEVLDIANTGKYNTGYGNLGDCNTGDCNVGNQNTGSGNIGDRNTGIYNEGRSNIGEYNAGSYNIGDENIGSFNVGAGNNGFCNVGNYNSGDYNSGNFNTGDWNTGDFNITSHTAGCFMTERSNMMFFNKPSDWSYRQWINSSAYRILSSMPRLRKPIWVYASEMSEKEKKELSYIEITDGRLIISECSDDVCQKWWDEKLSEECKECIKALPNFDAEIFFKCTGIKVD